jgi:hypothetical protein
VSLQLQPRATAYTFMAMVPMWLSSWTLALALHAPESVAAPTLPPPRPEPVPGAADDRRGMRRRVPAAVLLTLAVGSMAGLVATQVIRDAGLRSCLRAQGRARSGHSDDFQAALCPIDVALSPGLLGAMALAPAAVALAAGGGAMLGRGDVNYGVQRDPKQLRRRIRNSAIVLGVSGGVLITASLALYFASINRPFDVSEIALQRARFAITDLATIGMAASATVLARANTFRRRTNKLAVSPMIGGGVHGIALAGRF